LAEYPPWKVGGEGRAASRFPDHAWEYQKKGGAVFTDGLKKGKGKGWGMRKGSQSKGKNSAFLWERRGKRGKTAGEKHGRGAHHGTGARNAIGVVAVGRNKRDI